MPLPSQLDTETLLRQSRPNMPGIFGLTKTEFIKFEMDSEYHDRCDNYTFSSARLGKGTPYENQDLALFKPDKTDAVLLAQDQHGVSRRSLVKYNSVIDCNPQFSIIYLEFNAVSKDKLLYDLADSPVPSSMWYARSFFQLLKNMREWQFAKEHLDPEHPMAIYSDLALTTLNPPQNILDEIDSWPDMHLAMFINGNSDYKKIPHPYPEPSEEMKNWVLAKAELHKKQTYEQVLDKLLNP